MVHIKLRIINDLSFYFDCFKMCEWNKEWKLGNKKLNNSPLKKHIKGDDLFAFVCLISRAHFNGFRSCPVASPSITALDWYDISAPSLFTWKFSSSCYGKLCMLIRCMSFESNTEKNSEMKIVSVNKLIIKINWAPCMCSRFSVDVIYAAHTSFFEHMESGWEKIYSTNVEKLH